MTGPPPFSGPPPAGPPPFPHQGSTPAQPPPSYQVPPPTPSHPGPPPPVPPGPGVQPPFAAAPVEGRTARLWLGLGVVGAALAVCCGGGLLAFVGFVITGTQALNEQADRVVGDYLDAVIAEDWPRAYERLCDRDQQAESLEAFARREARAPDIASYELGDLDLTRPELRLPVELTYTEGGRERVEVPLEQDTSTGELEVCGFDR